MSESETTKRPLMMKLSLVLISTLIMMLFMEGVLQVVIRIRDGKWLFQKPEGSRVPYVRVVDDQRRFTLRPGFTAERGRLTINRSGFRVVARPVSESGGIIVHAGDSIPFGVGVGNRQTYPYFIDKLIEEKGLPLSVINAGVPSYNLRQSFARLRHEVLKKYDLSRIRLITMHQANDVFLLSYYRDRWYPGITWLERRFLDKQSFSEKIAVLHYGRMVLDKLGIYGDSEDQSIRKRRMARGRRDKSYRYSNYEGDRKKYDRFDSSEMVKDAMNILRRELPFYREHGITVVFLPIDPFYYQLSNREKNPNLSKWRNFQFVADATNRMIPRYNDMLREICAEFDNAYYFETRHILDARNREALYADHIHFSGRGNRIIAQKLLEFFLRQELITTDSRAQQAVR